MTWEQRKTDVELICKTCAGARFGKPFPPPNSIPPGPYWVSICSDGSIEPMCWDCFYELTND